MLKAEAEGITWQIALLFLPSFYLEEKKFGKK